MSFNLDEISKTDIINLAVKIYKEIAKRKKAGKMNYTISEQKSKAYQILWNEAKKHLTQDEITILLEEQEKTKSTIKPSYYSLAKPYYRMYFDSLDEGLKNAKWDDKDILVDTKWDGLRVTIGKSNGKGWAYVDPDGLKEKSPNISKRIPAIIKEIEDNFPDNTVLDGEFLAIHPNKKEMLHRTVANSILNSNMSGQELEDYAIIFVFDVLFYNGQDLRPLPLHERLEYLQRLKSTKHIWIEKISKKFPTKADGFIISATDKNKAEKIKKIADFLENAKNGRPKYCAEGVMVKRLDWKYEYPINHGWAKTKFFHEIDLRVIDKKLVKGSKNVWNYFLGYDTPLEYAKAYLNMPHKDWYGKVYAFKDGKVIANGKDCIKYLDDKDVYFVTKMGKTDNTKIQADVNDIIRIAAEEVLKYDNPENPEYPRYSFYIGRVLEPVPEKHVTDRIGLIDMLSKFEPKRIPVDELRHITENPLENKSNKEYEFVLQLHIPGKSVDMNPHYDLRWKLSDTSKEECNIYANPIHLEEGEYARARHKLIKYEPQDTLNSWMECKDEFLERYIESIGKTYIYCIDKGKLQILDHSDNDITLKINGDQLKGIYKLRKRGEGWIFMKVGNIQKSIKISKDDIIKFVEDGKIPDDVYKQIAKEMEPLPKEFYVDYKEAKMAWAQFHYRGIDPEKMDKFKKGEISLAKLIEGESVHVDIRMLFDKDTFIQWVITQNYAKDYIDTLKGENDPKTGNVSKGLGIVKPSALEPSQFKTIEIKDTVLDEKGAKLLASYDLPKHSFIINQGDVGATPYTASYMSAIWLGTVKAGVQRKDEHEYFFYPDPSLPNKNKELLNGRFIIRCFKTPQGDKRWWFWKAKNDPYPMDSIYHADCAHYYPVKAKDVDKFGHKAYREESKKKFLEKLKKR